MKGIKNFCFNIFLDFKLLSYSFKSFFDLIICKYFCCCSCAKKKNLCCCCFCWECCHKDYQNNENNESNESCCTKCCFECCKKVDDEDFELNTQYFCYCYKAKKHLKWFDFFIKDETQIKFIPLLTQYYLIQLSTIAFETIIDENNDEENNKFNSFKNILYYLGFLSFSLLLFFYFTISFGKIFTYLSKSIKKKRENKIKESTIVIIKSAEFTRKISEEILHGTYGIVIFIAFYSLIFSFICLKKDIKNNYYFYIPILMNKFFSFAFAYNCTVVTDKEEDVDYFSSATLLSIHLFLWNIIMYFIKKFPLKYLLYLQIGLSSFIIIIFIFFLSLFMCCFGMCCFTFLYLLSFIPCGGCWFFRCYRKHKCSKTYENENCRKYFEDLFESRFLNKEE